MTLNFQPTCSNHPGKTVAFALSLLCFLLANYPLYPQNRKIDSLLTKIQNLPDNEDKTFTLIRLAIAYKHARDSTGLSYARKALQLARKLSLEKSMGDALSQMGSFAKQAHRYPEALQLFDSALYYYKRTQSIGSQADVFNQKGIIL